MLSLQVLQKTWACRSHWTLALQLSQILTNLQHLSLWARHNINNSVFSFLCQLATWNCLHLLLSATGATINRYLPAAGPTAANLPHQHVVGKWLDRWTDRRTDARQFHRPCSAYYASSVNNPITLQAHHYKPGARCKSKTDCHNQEIAAQSRNGKFSREQSAAAKLSASSGIEHWILNKVYVFSAVTRPLFSYKMATRVWNV